MAAPQIEPMKEGREARQALPGWLVPYAPNHDAARAALTTPEKVLFDTLWDRGCGYATPGLSHGEQNRLIQFLGPAPTGPAPAPQKEGP